MSEVEFQAYRDGADSSVFFRVNAAIAGVCTALVVYPVVIAGAAGMLRLRWYSLSLTAALFALLPCSLMWVVSAPIGVWATVVLLQADVKAAFYSPTTS